MISIAESENATGWVDRLYATMPSCDFHDDVLTRVTTSLAVRELPPCGWSDLSTPAALRSFLRDRLMSCPTLVLSDDAHGRRNPREPRSRAVSALGG